MPNIAKVHYITEKGKGTVIITKIDNFLSPSEIKERYGAIVYYLYSLSKEKVYRKEDCEYRFDKKMKSIFDSTKPDVPFHLHIPYLPYRMTRKHFNEAINQMRRAGEVLSECIRIAKDLKINISEESREKIIDI